MARQAAREIIELFATEMYGHSPGRPAKMTFKVFDNDPQRTWRKGHAKAGDGFLFWRNRRAKDGSANLFAKLCKKARPRDFGTELRRQSCD